MIRYGRTPLALNRWYHLAGVYDAAAQTLNVYLNGRPDDGCQLGHVTNRQHFSGPRHVFLGRHGSNEGFEFAGSIDDVRIYSRALTAREIEAEVMSAGASVSPPDAAAVAEGYAPDAPRDERCLATPWVILAMQRTVLAMRGTDIESTDARVAGLIVSSGMLVAIACLGLWPSAGYRVPSLVLSFLCGCLLVPSISPVVPPLFLWIVPLLTLVGGASVVVSTRSDAQ